MAETLNPNRVIQESGIDGVQTGFPEGVDSFSHPLYIRPTQLRWMENASVEGGFPQVRPGNKTRFTFDLSDTEGPFYQWWSGQGFPLIHPQMLEQFQPSTGGPQLIFAISGSVWWAPINYDGSLGSPTRIETLQFNANADQLTGTRCTQTASIISGKYANNIVPRNLIVIQDGINRAGIWDGLLGQTMNPTKNITTDSTGNTLYTNGYNETRIGLWCAWSGNRLWVFQDRIGYASDLGDPTHFTEELRLDSVPMIVFPESITAAIDRGTSGTTRSQVVVMSAKSVWTIWSGIQARFPSSNSQGWAFTADFVAKIFDGVGCVAGKSLTIHRGLLYWKSLEGLVLFDSTGTVNSSQNLPIIDQEMAYSKRRVAASLNPGADLTCAGTRGSTVFWSVPVGATTNGRCYCGHTQVLDRQTTVVRSVGLDGPFSYGTTGWQGIWTGIRPVAWAHQILGSSDHTYALSMDADGVVRIWEGFQANRADNGHEIPWLVETRLHRVAPSVFDYSNFRHFRVLLDQIKGNLQFSGAWRGMRSRYHEIMNIPITSTPGSVLTPLPQFSPVVNSTEHYNFGFQSRTVVSPDVRGPGGNCQAVGVESQYEDARDHAFSLLFKLTGRGALSAYRIAADQIPDNTEGEGNLSKSTGVVEEGFNIVSPSDCPKHIDGATPVYVFADSPASETFSPYQPDAVELPAYASPVT